jgi:hypothetical protein
MEKWRIGNTENGHGNVGIILIGEDGVDHILSVKKIEAGFEFMEECDGYFSNTYSKEAALKVVDELREWIVNQ